MYIFLSQIQIGSYRVRSIRVGSFWFRFFQVKEIWTQKVLVNFRFGFGSVSVWDFGSRLKSPGLSSTKSCLRSKLIRLSREPLRSPENKEPGPKPDPNSRCTYSSKLSNWLQSQESLPSFHKGTSQIYLWKPGEIHHNPSKTSYHVQYQYPENQGMYSTESFR